MESLSPAIGQKAIFPSTTGYTDHDLFLDSVKVRTVRNLNRACRRLRIRVQAGNGVPKNAAAGVGGIDFSDPDWKLKYSREFEARFNIPHMTDVFPDAVSYPSTFCLKMRTPITEKFAEGYPSDEKWHGYINNNDRVLLKVINYSSPTSAGAECIDSNCSWVEQWVHRAGPREKIFFKPEEVKAAIVTCGGLCPGLNDVIRQIVITLEIYGVKKIVGIPFGYRGFSEKGLAEMPLSRKVVQNVHLSGGSLLGVSRGGPKVSDIVDSIQERGINMLFVLGGNGTHAGANAIHDECRKRRIKAAVVGVPKTIDNDIMLMDKTFGFDTAVEEAQRAINSAYIEAHSAYRGIGIVKLMGRSSGFIAMQASLASGQIDICLIPEVPFNLHGPHGVLRHLKYLLETKGSAVVCAAEGAGQDFLEKTNAKDASGNAVLGDIGVYLQQEVKKYFKELGQTADVKYIDPTYMIRACRANASDGILCTVLGQNAVHGAFAGYSGITVGICNTHYVYFPIPEVISKPRVVDPNSRMWHRCLTSTGQPDFL
ncbi:ATP-dependent 6-phosphofructokinase 5, chloroplastic-like [Solanum pennellii]|uniref:ATP-dependent 6-phosphofructokinase n=1 Tax=Solanum pennellii TaxID=28526 RepID=A0ABM1GID8_SOLPN|nr:ATP-dependent 6-phosphofructokinase 5, chloroplastic-like [Solanum pennellii]